MKPARTREKIMKAWLKCWLMERVFVVEKKQIDRFISQLETEKAIMRKEIKEEARIARMKIPTRRRIDELLLSKREEVQRGLSVKAGEPVLRSILTLMDAKQQAHIEAAGVAGLYADEAKAEARCVVALQEMQEIILEEVEKAVAETR
jgi:hypothetical protein